MISVAQQLAQASVHAARLQAEKAIKAGQDQIRQKIKAEARARQWATRKEKTGLVSELLARLPVGRANAIPLSGVEALFENFAYAPTGISSALSWLCKNNQVCRDGNPGAYLYYLPKP